MPVSKVIQKTSYEFTTDNPNGGQSVAWEVVAKPHETIIRTSVYMEGEGGIAIEHIWELAKQLRAMGFAPKE